MGKGAPLRWLENRLLRGHLRGRGIEIGALWRPFSLREAARAWYVDYLLPDQVSVVYSELDLPVVRVDVVADAAQLPFAPATLDFIIASHLLEHLPFPLVALRHWYDLLAPNGALLLRIPDKRFTFDHRRRRTCITHLVEEYEHPENFDRRAHFVEWVRDVNQIDPNGSAFTDQLEHLMNIGYSIHYHAWIDQDVAEIIEWTQRQWGLRWHRELFWRAHFYRKETVAILRRDSTSLVSFRGS
jgi:predicted SAM-dependent methyltransferase